MSENVTFAAVGDISFSGGIGERLEREGPSALFYAVRPILAQAHLCFANHESVYTPPDFPNDQRDPRALWGPLAGVEALRAAGFHVLNLAQNHVYDCGSVGFRYTRRVLEGAGFVTLGVGESEEEARALRVVERNGVRFGFLAYLEDCNYSIGVQRPAVAYCERETVVADILAARPQVDILVVSVHADLEFSDAPCPQRQEDGRAFAEAGADLVLMHHPHVPQGIERWGKSLICYSLGNFTFELGAYQRNGSPRTSDSFILLVSCSRQGVEAFRRVPCRLPPEPGPVTPLQGAPAEHLLRDFERLDAILADPCQMAAIWEARVWQALRASWKLIRQHEDPDEAFAKTLWRFHALGEHKRWMETAIRLSWKAHRARMVECPEHVRPHAVVGF
ncbi:MAG: CapA family protein [Armatimonadota bacterium]|nr:CapA family protein [Armatimonadota bacterium]